MKKAKRTYKRLKAVRRLRRMLGWDLFRKRYLRFGRPVAWVSSGAPVEILLAFGVLPLYPENYGAICGAAKVADRLCVEAETRGYSKDLCSYARASLGSLLEPGLAPMGGLPRPDLILSCNNICHTITKWFEELAARLGVPIFSIDTPFLDEEEPDRHYLDYVTGQLREIIGSLEEQLGRSFPQEQFVKILYRSNRGIQLWGEVQQLCSTRPSPLNVPDLFLTMVPIVSFRGTHTCNRFYERLRDEVNGRILRGEAAVEGERHRLIWDNIAIWFRLYRFFKTFAEGGACFVASTYTDAWKGELWKGEGGDLDPLEAVAWAYATTYLNRGVRYRISDILRKIEYYGADGVVMHSNRSCKPYSLGQYLIKEVVARESGVPVLMVEADMCDGRSFSEPQIEGKIATFLEMLGSRKG
jgi:benzoyl-CoA reductase/2-hydroxyglutaryl-CoA dehydratase subunit BcrC/BadD/HgdB